MRDIAAAHVRAITHPDSQFDLFNISARSPFTPDDLPTLVSDAPSVIRRYFPNAEQIFHQHGWQLPQSIDCVYVIEKAERNLGYQPQHNFAQYLRELQISLSKLV